MSGQQSRREEFVNETKSRWAVTTVVVCSRFGIRTRTADGARSSRANQIVPRRRSSGTSSRQILRRGTLPTNKARWTVEQAAIQWVEDHAAHLNSPKARANEQSYLRQLVRVLGKRTLQDIALDDLKRYQRERSKKVQARPINIELAILVAILKEANLWKGNLVHYKRMSESESEVGKALTLKRPRHLEATAAKKDAWLVAYCAEVLAANTGLRGGEIKKLRMCAIDLESRRIMVRRESAKISAGCPHHRTQSGGH